MVGMVGLMVVLIMIRLIIVITLMLMLMLMAMVVAVIEELRSWVVVATVKNRNAPKNIANASTQVYSAIPSANANNAKIYWTARIHN